VVGGDLRVLQLRGMGIVGGASIECERICGGAGNWDGGIDVLEMEERQGWKKLQTSNFKLHPPSSKHYGATRRSAKFEASKKV